MPNQNDQNMQPASPETPPQKQLSSLAKWAFRFLIAGFVLGIAGLPVIDLPDAFFVPALICFALSLILGFCALVQIGNSNENLKGLPRSLVSVFISGIILLAAIIGLGGSKYDFKIICGTHLNGLGKAILSYSNDYNDRLPTASRWCDLLVERADVSVASFLCRSSDAVKGESSYAMNKYIADTNITYPADVVVLFETDYGRTAKRSRWKLGQMRKNNDKYISIKEVNTVPAVIRSDKLDKLRWNQVGGPEILTLDHHNGEGCNILFGDSHVEFVKKEDIPKLRWKP